MKGAIVEKKEIHEALIGASVKTIGVLVTDGADHGNVTADIKSEATELMPHLCSKFIGHGYTTKEAIKMASIVMAMTCSAAILTVLEAY